MPDHVGDRRIRLQAAGLLVLGTASLALYALLALGMRHSGAGQDVLAFLGVLLILFLLHWTALPLARRTARRWEGGTVAVILGFALLFRAMLLPAGLSGPDPAAALARDLGGGTGYSTFLLYDNDVWRYLWDGHLGASGLNPYRFTPAEIAERALAGEPPFSELLADEIWWDVLDNVSFQDYVTVYPPLAQLLFALSQALAPASVFVLKLGIALADLGACLVLAALLAALGRPRYLVLLYAWNPLPITEFAGSGHADALMVLLLTLAVLLLVRGRGVTALVVLGLGGLAKAAALVLTFLFLGRTRPRQWIALPATLALGLLPFAPALGRLVSGLAVYGREWVFNSGPWAVLRALAETAGAADPAAVAHLVARGLVVLLAVAAFRAGRGGPAGAVRTACAVMAALVLLHSAVMPWYLPWVLPLAVAAGFGAWSVLTLTAPLSYLFYIDGVEQAWWLWGEYLLFAAAAGLELARRRRGRRAVARAPR